MRQISRRLLLQEALLSDDPVARPWLLKPKH